MGTPHLPLTVYYFMEEKSIHINLSAVCLFPVQFPTRARDTKIPAIQTGIFVLGCLERIELSIPLPQSGVLPLNYRHHKLSLLNLIMVDEEMAIMTQPKKVGWFVVVSVSVDMVYRQNTCIDDATPSTSHRFACVF